MYLKQDIHSLVRSSVIYGRAGEEVTVIRDATDVLIVEGKYGRFPVRREHLAEEKEQPKTSEELVPKIEAESKTTIKPARKKSNIKSSINLFS